MKSTRVNLRMKEEVKEQAKRQADELGLDLTSYITMLIKKDSKGETKMETNKKYVSTQEPYLTGPIGQGVYQALGIDQEGNQVTLTWEILDGYNPAEDPEELACDWENPDRAVILLDSASYLESLATGGEARQIPGKGCDYIIIKDYTGEEIAYAEEIAPEDETWEDAEWNQERIDRLVADIKKQLKEI